MRKRKALSVQKRFVLRHSLQYNCALLVQRRLFNNLNFQARRSTTQTIRVSVFMYGFIHTADSSTACAPSAHRNRLPVRPIRNTLMRMSLCMCMCMRGMTRNTPPLEGLQQT